MFISLNSKVKYVFFCKADLPVIKTSCSVCRVKDYQTGTAKAGGAREVGKVMGDGQTMCYSQDCLKLCLLAVILLLLLSSCQTMPPARFPLPSLILLCKQILLHFCCFAKLYAGYWEAGQNRCGGLTLGSMPFLSSNSNISCGWVPHVVFIGSSKSPSHFVLFQTNATTSWLVFSFRVKCLWIMVKFAKQTRRWGDGHCHYYHQGKIIIRINMATVWW